MKAIDRFSSKAEGYTQGRWDYAEEAIAAVVRACRLSPDAAVADIGSGTGMLTRHFATRVGTVFGVEPNAAMRAVAVEALVGFPAFRSVDGRSDATTLPDASVDLITVGRALHWFRPETTRAEFLRILKPDGQLAIFQIPCTNPALRAALDKVRVEENGWDEEGDRQRLEQRPWSFYFGHETFERMAVPGVAHETWDAFLRRITSFSVAPGPMHPSRPQLERRLREVFDTYAVDGILSVPNATEAAFGSVHH